MLLCATNLLYLTQTKLQHCKMKVGKSYDNYEIIPIKRSGENVTR